MLRRVSIVATILIWATLSLSAQQNKVVSNGNIEYRYTPTDQKSQSAVTFGQRLYNTTSIGGNRSATASFTVAPTYSADKEWSLAVIGDILYRTKNQTSRPHILTIGATASLAGHYGASVDGTNFFNRGKHRLSYHIGAQSTPLALFGLNYTTSTLNNAGRYVEEVYAGAIRYTSSIAEKFLLGAYIDYRYDEATDFDLYSSMIVGDKETLFYGAGIGAILGLRTSYEEEINLRHGVDITFDILLRPQFSSNLDSDIWQISGLFDYYQPLWRGALMVVDLYGEHHSKGTPWLLLAKLGSDCRMRGYYPGRYNGNSLVSAQLELRQRIARFVVITAWAGAGTIFSEYDRFDTSKILPNYGAGLRLYLNATTALRLDVGFGKDCRNFIIGLNEAF